MLRCATAFVGIGSGFSRQHNPGTIVARSISEAGSCFADNDESRNRRACGMGYRAADAMADRPADRKKMDANDLHPVRRIDGRGEKIMEARSSDSHSAMAMTAQKQARQLAKRWMHGVTKPYRQQ